MGRVLGLVVVAAVLAAVAAGGWWWWDQRQNAAAADGDALPALTKVDATRTYLDGPGKIVAAMFDVTPNVVDDTEGTCAGRVKGYLSGLASPNELSVAAGKVPDPTARDLSLAHVGLLTEYAASCKGSEEETEQAGERLTENKASFDELMAEDTK